jgi:hypothetical protein
MKNGLELHVTVMDYNSVTVNLYKINKTVFMSIANEIDTHEEDEVVQEFISKQGHHLSEVNYMYSPNEIEVISE